MHLLDFFDNSKYKTDLVSGYALHFLTDDRGVKRVIHFGDYRTILKADFEDIIATANEYFGYDPKHGLSYEGDLIHYRPHERNFISVRVLENYVIIANFDFKTLGKWMESYYQLWHPSEISKRESIRNCQPTAVSNHDSGL